MYGMLDPTAELKLKLKDSQRRIDSKKQQIEDMQNELTLLRQQQFSFFKHGILYTEFHESMSALNGFWMLQTGKDRSGEKLDKRRKYPDIESLKRFQSELSTYLGLSCDITITEAYNYNMGEAAGFEFDYKGYTWGIEIPNVDVIQWRHFDESGPSCFYLKLQYKERLSQMIFFETISISELKGEIDKKVEELSKEK